LRILFAEKFAEIFTGKFFRIVFYLFGFN